MQALHLKSLPDANLASGLSKSEQQDKVAHFGIDKVFSTFRANWWKWLFGHPR
jgi:hypothetical protein